MRILVKCFGLVAIFVIVMAMLLSLAETVILANELDKASKIAVEQTQKKMKEVTVSRLKGIEDTFSDDEYENCFVESFMGLVDNKDEYEIKVQANASKGIIMVDISAKNNLVKDVKNINIVDVLEETDTDEENLKFEKQNLNARNDNVIFEKFFDDEVRLSDFYIDATSYMVSDESKYFDCTPELSIYGDDDRLLKRFDFISGARTYREYKFSEKPVLRHIKVVYCKSSTDFDVIEDFDETLENLRQNLSVISEEKVYNRYIRDSSSLYDNSLWQKDIYAEVLNEYLGKLYA